MSKIPPKADTQWLREHGFRKQRNMLVWSVAIRDKREKVRLACPYFFIDVVFCDGHGWHSCVSARKIAQAIWLEVAPEEARLSAGIPSYWIESAVMPLGFSTGAKTAREAVISAVGCAFVNTRNITDKEFYNIADLNEDFGK